MVDLPALFAAWKGVQGDSGIYFSHTENGSSWVPQQPVSGVGTSHTPSLTYFHTRLTSSHIDGLFMAWKGARDDSGIYWSHTDDGASWAPQQRVQDAGTNRGPSLAVFNGRLFMAWKGVGDDSGIYWSHTDRGLAPQDWAAQHRVPDVGTSEAPSLAVFNDRLFMVWKGVGDDSGIYWSSTLDGASWAPQQRVPGVGTSDGPSLAAFFGFYTAGQLVMAWKGVDDDQGIYRSFTFDGDFWAPQHRFIDVGTSKGPRLSSLGTFGPFRQGRLWMAWKGARDDSGIYWSHTDEAAFADWIPQQGPVPQAGTSEGAALAFFAPVASRTPFLDGMEVTQSIQDMSQSVKLIAKKKTVARVYLGNMNVVASDVPVRGELSVKRLPGGPTTTVTSANTITLGSLNDVSLQDKRRNVRRSLNFVLPEDLTSEGQLELRLASLSDFLTGFPFNVNLEQLSFPKTVGFEESPPLRIRIVGMSYSFGTPPTTRAPSPTDFDLIKSWLRRAYPVAQVISSQATVSANATPPFTAAAINTQLAAIRALDVNGGGVDRRTHYYGLVSDTGFFMRGQAATVPATPDPADVAAGPTGNPRNQGPTISWDTHASYGDWYAGHELGHTFGRQHPGFCGVPCMAFNSPSAPANCQQMDDPSYPFPTGQLSDGSMNFVGFDVGDPSNSLPMAAFPGDSSHDVMTYCDNLWLSSYTYNGIRDRLIAENSTHEERLLPGPVAWEEMAGDRNFLSVVGTVNLTRGEGKISYVNPLPQGELSAADRHGRVVLRVKRADGQVLHEYRVGVKPFSDQLPEEDQLALLDAVIVVYPEARVVEMLVDGETVDTFRAGDTPPGARRPRRLEAEPHLLSLAWETDARTEGEHTYTVQVSTDNGSTWQTLAVGLAAPEFTIARDQFRGAESVLARVTATDGFRSAVVTSEPLPLFPQY